MELNDTRSNVGNETNEKRQCKLTPKGFEHKVERLQEERQSKVRKIRTAIRESKDLMQSANNVEKVRACLANISSLFKEANHFHGVVIPMLPPDEQEKQNTWFDNVEKHKTAFEEEMNKWLLEVQEFPDAPTEGAVASCMRSTVPNNELDIGKAFEDNIGPSDSVSNVSGRSKKRSTVGSKYSSTTSSARVRAEAETAALMARQKLMKEKHALEEQQEHLRRKMEEQQEQFRRRKEELDLDMELAASMAKVALLDINESAGKTLKEALSKQYGQERTLFFKCSVESEEQVIAAFQRTMETFGGIDIVCNNAGILDEAKWEKTISINLTSVIRVSYLAMEHMNKLSGGKGGTIINIASMAGLHPLSFCPTYTATKYAVIGFTRAMAAASASASYGIRFNAVCPTLVQTGLFASISDNLGQFSHLAHCLQEPINRGIMNVSEVAECVLDLVTDETKNGEALVKSPSIKKYVIFPTFATLTQ